MSQDQVTARVYIDGGPTVRLQVPYVAGDTPEHHVYMTRDEWLRDIAYRLDHEKCVEGMTAEGDLIVIPAGRVIDVVFPVSRQDAESGMDEDQRNYEAQLNAHGEIERIVKAYGPEFVDAYISDRAFAGEVVVQTTAGVTGRGDEFVGIISAYEDGDFTIDGKGRTLYAGVDRIHAVLCWNWASYRISGNLDQMTSAGFAFGPESIAKALGQSLR